MPNLALIWRSADQILAIEFRSIIEVLPPVSCRSAPGTPDWIRGLFVYRGSLIPLVDMARLLGAAHTIDRRANRVIVVRASNPDVPIDWPVGLWVESALGIEQIDFAAAGGHPGFATDGGEYLGPVAQSRWGEVQLVRSQAIFTPEQARIMTQRLTEATA